MQPTVWLGECHPAGADMSGCSGAVRTVGGKGFPSGKILTGQKVRLKARLGSDKGIAEL